MHLYYSKTQRTMTAVLVFFLALLFFRALATAQEKQPPKESSASVTVEKISDHEWKIINKNGESVGTIKSERLQTFQFYDTTGGLVGTILESGAWQHRLYRSRNTLIQPDEAQLYLDALEASKILKK